MVNEELFNRFAIFCLLFMIGFIICLANDNHTEETKRECFLLLMRRLFFVFVLCLFLVNFDRLDILYKFINIQINVDVDININFNSKS